MQDLDLISHGSVSRYVQRKAERWDFWKHDCEFFVLHRQLGKMSYNPLIPKLWVLTSKILECKGCECIIYECENIDDVQDSMDGDLGQRVSKEQSHKAMGPSENKKWFP